MATIVGDADAVLGVWIEDGLISEELLSACPNLKYIATGAHGFGKIDYAATKRHGVTVTNTLYGDVTIAQYAMGLLLDICHNISIHSEYYKKQKWEDESEKRIITPQVELYEKTIGIIGLGNIGYRVAQMAHGFGMKVISYSRTKKEGEKYDFIEQVDLETVLTTSDVISIHCPLTDTTKNLINKETINKMKQGVIIINTSRGAVIDEDALYEALENGKVRAAGLDVLCGEPLQSPCKLMELDNVKVTEHMAWLTIESRIRGNRMMCENLLNWIHGNPTSVINY